MASDDWLWNAVRALVRGHVAGEAGELEGKLCHLSIRQEGDLLGPKRVEKWKCLSVDGWWRDATLQEVWEIVFHHLRTRGLGTGMMLDPVAMLMDVFFKYHTHRIPEDDETWRI